MRKEPLVPWPVMRTALPIDLAEYHTAVKYRLLIRKRRGVVPLA
jgi:hypothetical protein